MTGVLVYLPLLILGYHVLVTTGVVGVGTAVEAVVLGVGYMSGPRGADGGTTRCETTFSFSLEHLAQLTVEG